MIHSELCSACGGPLQLGVGLVGPPKKDRKHNIKNKNYPSHDLCRNWRKTSILNKTLYFVRR